MNSADAVFPPFIYPYSITYRTLTIMVTVFIDYSPSFPPLSPDKLVLNSMSASPPPSVFKSLGSYADRIGKTPNGQHIKSPPPHSTPLQSTPAQSSSMSSNTNTNTSTTSASASTKVSTPRTPTTGSEVQVDDGPWETVNPKAKGKQDRERDHVEKGSNSRNWRDRPREKAGESSKDGQSEKKASAHVGAGGGTKGKKGSATNPASAALSSSLTRSSIDNGKSQPAASTSRTTAPPSKPAWGLPASKPAAKAAASTSTDPVPTPKPTAKPNPSAKTNTTPASPSINGTTAVSSVSGDTPAEPRQSTAGPSSTPSTKLNKEVKEKAVSTPSQDTQEKKEEARAEVNTPAPAPARVAAPPPTNPWNTRKPVLASPATITVAASAAESKQSSRIQFGQLSPSAEAANPLPNGHANGHAEEPVKIGGKKKKKENTPVVIDASQWPDVAQAQVVKTETKKESKPLEENVEEVQIGSEFILTERGDGTD